MLKGNCKCYACLNRSHSRKHTTDILISEPFPPPSQSRMLSDEECSLLAYSHLLVLSPLIRDALVKVEEIKVTSTSSGLYAI